MKIMRVGELLTVIPAITYESEITIVMYAIEQCKYVRKGTVETVVGEMDSYIFDMLGSKIEYDALRDRYRIDAVYTTKQLEKIRNGIEL